MKDIIEVDSLAVDYGDLRAVDGISFRVEEAEIFGFLGPNGAGKTTTIKVLCALLHPTSGSARIAGYDVVTEPHSVREQIGLVFQSSSLDDKLTGRENLSFHGRLYNMGSELIESRIRNLSARVGLEGRIQDPVESYSGGMKRRLELIRGFLHHPRVLFLDEPTLGLDPQTRTHIWDYIEQLQEEEQISIFLTTHYMDEVELAGRAAIIDKGKIIALDTIKALKDDLGGDLIVLKAEDNREIAREIEERYGYQVSQRDSTLRITVPRGEEFIPTLMNELGRRVHSINLHEPTMEDVFLELTGKQIRESGPEKSKRMMRGH